MNFGKTPRRWLYIAISLFGIGFELTQREDIRWPLLAGYTFIILVTVYSLQAENDKNTEESE